MSKKYHINPETKEVGRCSANIQCRFATNGEEPPHYENIYEAHEEAERQLDEEHGSFNSLNNESEEIDNYIEIPDNHSFEPITKSERRWQAPDEHFGPGDYMEYEGNVYQVADTERIYNNADSEYDYHIYTEDGTDILILEYSWKNNENLDIEKLTDDFEDTPVPPGSYGAKLGDYIEIGGPMKYNDELYIVEDYEYNRAILAYEITTDRGKIYIDDDEWYHNVSPTVFIPKQI